MKATTPCFLPLIFSLFHFFFTWQIPPHSPATCRRLIRPRHRPRYINATRHRISSSLYTRFFRHHCPLHEKEEDKPTCFCCDDQRRVPVRGERVRAARRVCCAAFTITFHDLLPDHVPARADVAARFTPAQKRPTLLRPHRYFHISPSLLPARHTIRCGRHAMRLALSHMLQNQTTCAFSYMPPLFAAIHATCCYALLLFCLFAKELCHISCRAESKAHHHIATHHVAACHLLRGM